MKKTKILILAAAAMLTAACSSDEDAQQQTALSEGGWSEYVTVTAGTPGNAASSTGGPKRVKVNTENPQKSLWETGDKLTIWTGETCSTANMSESGFTLTSGADTGTGKFSGRLTSTSAPTSSTKLIAIIDNGSDAIDASAGNSVSADLSEQQGATAASALDYELFYATSTNGARSFTFTHKMALIKWTIKVNGASDNDVCDIVLSGTGLKNSATLDPATGTLTVGSSDGTITLKGVTLTSAASTELYVVLPPCTVSSGITATLTMTSGSKEGGIATGNLGDGNAITVAANNYYTAGVNEFTPVDVVLDVVDLGLQSGTKWAKCNVGASSPEEYGDFFAWGETTGYSSANTTDGHAFNWANYSLCNGTNTTLTKYNNNSSYGTVDNKTTLEATDDAATVVLGSEWRMPTGAEFDELLTAYPKSLTSGSKRRAWLANYNSTGVAGLAFYDASGNILLFLPAAGYRGTSLGNQGAYGRYWSSSLDESDARNARILYFSSGDSYMNGPSRYFGFSVRPVLAQ